MRSRGYESTRIEGRRHLVCVKCRRPLVKGHNPPYPVPEPGMPVLTEGMKQAVCGPDYLEMYAFMYPEADAFEVFDGRVPNSLPVPWGEAPAPSDKEPDGFVKWEQALMEARSSAGAETVEDAFHRLWIAPKPDVTTSGIIEDIEEVEPQAV